MSLNYPRPDSIQNIQTYVDAWKNSRAALERSIEMISEERFAEPLPDHSWSASQIVEHIALSQERFARVIPMILKGRLGSTCDKPGAANYDTIEADFSVHKNVKNPDAVTPVKVLSKPEALKLMNDAMALFEKNISGVDFATLKKWSFEHFALGPLNIVEYIWVLILHENHHTYLLREKYV